MTKDELIAKLEQEWVLLEAAIDGLDDEQMTQIPVLEAWTVKDLLAHIAMCESLLVTALFKLERGIVPDDLSDAQVEIQNEQYYRQQKDRSLEQVVEDLQGVHLALINRLGATSEKTLTDPKKYRWMKGEPLSKFISEDSIEHYHEHRQQIQTWRKKQGV